jgi:hypothetical protein
MVGFFALLFGTVINFLVFLSSIGVNWYDR